MRNLLSRMLLSHRQCIAYIQNCVDVGRNKKEGITGDKSDYSRVWSPNRDTCPLMAGRVTGWRSLPSEATGRLYLLAATCTAFGKLDFEHGVCPQVHSRKRVHVVLSPPRAITLYIHLPYTYSPSCTVRTRENVLNFFTYDNSLDESKRARNPKLSTSSWKESDST